MPVETREGRIFFVLVDLFGRENMTDGSAEGEAFVAGNAAGFFGFVPQPALNQIRLGEKRPAHGEELDFIGPLFHNGQRPIAAVLDNGDR